MTVVKTYEAPPVREKEILRYAGCGGESPLPPGLLNACLREAAHAFTYKVCYTVFELRLQADLCDFGAFSVKSHDLSRNLAGCARAVVFAATVGFGIDRLIAKYSAVSPSRAVLFQALGTERIEALCDLFCADIREELKAAAKPRFSPGYGDFDLSYQKEIFSILNCEKRIGVALTESMLMTPSKSVTAVIGLY